jgi:hypothetical protein
MIIWSPLAKYVFDLDVCVLDGAFAAPTRSVSVVVNLEISRWAGWARDGRGAAVSVLILG